MPTKIRLQRHGKKRNAFFHIVIADNRAPRDGRFIEKIGTYNPNTNPATIDLEFEKALSWLKTGAQPTDTVRAILSYEGVLYRNHLDIGVKKGALTEAEADKRYEAWKNEKLAKIQKKVDTLEKASSEELKARQKSEEEVSKKREQDILAKNSAMAEAAAAEAAAEAPASEEAATDEAPAAEAKEEAPAAEAKEETPAAEAKEETPAAEAKEETPAAEAKEAATEASASEAPAEEKEASAEAAAPKKEESKEDEASEEEKA